MFNNIQILKIVVNLIYLIIIVKIVFTKSYNNLDC